MENQEEVTTLKFISKKQEAGNVYSFLFSTGDLNWKAGQSQGFILPELGGDENVNQHWFTIATSPLEKIIQVSTRVSDSLYKKTLDNLEEGAEIKVYGLGGDFVWNKSDERRKVFIAGGIGVTPFRSMIFDRDLRGKDLPVDLIYFNRTDEIPFQNDFAEIEKRHSEFKVFNEIGKTISFSEIKQVLPEIADREIYISGPEPMVEAVALQFKENGLEVKEDRFPGYTKINY